MDDRKGSSVLNLKKLKKVSNYKNKHYNNNLIKTYHEIETPSKEVYPTSYKDPWFYNEKNLKFQIESMKTSAYLSNNFHLSTAPNNTTNSSTYNIPTETTDESNLPNLFTMFNQVKINKMKLENCKKYEKPEFLYRQIFRSKGIFQQKYKPIDNKLNLDYADNEKQYELRLAKINKKLIEKGKMIKHFNKSEYLDNKLDEIRNKIIFMKGVIDYGYPGITIAKIREIEKTLKKKKEEDLKSNKYVTPCNFRVNESKMRDQKRKMFLTGAFEISHCGN